jgi:hypothetical protein
MSFDSSTLRQRRRALQLCVLYGICWRDEDAASASYATGMEASHVYAATDDKVYIYSHPNFMLQCNPSCYVLIKCKVEVFAADFTFFTSQTYIIWHKLRYHGRSCLAGVPRTHELQCAENHHCCTRTHPIPRMKGSKVHRNRHEHRILNGVKKTRQSRKRARCIVLSSQRIAQISRNA